MLSDEADSVEYDWIDGAETLERYRPGGYHPVMVGDLLHDRYRVVNKLGYVKVGVSGPSDSSTIRREIMALRALSGSVQLPSSSTRCGPPPPPESKLIPVPLDQFEVRGPNGIHPCYTMAPARCTLWEAAFCRLFPLDVTRALYGGLALALAYTYSCARAVAITRCDGKSLPPNVPPEETLPLDLVKRAHDFVLSDVRIRLSDFDETFAPATTIRRGEDCHTPLAFRAPEARFEPQAPLSYPSNIWSLATAIWEIIGIKAIFSKEYADINKVTAQQMDVLSPLPKTWWERWEGRGEFYIDNGKPREDQYPWPPMDEAFEMGVQKYRQMDGIGLFDKEEKAAILDLMRQMLAFRPEERPTAEEVLKSEWMVKWVLPDFDKSQRAK